jgi:hypothetical protein
MLPKPEVEDLRHLNQTGFLVRRGKLVARNMIETSHKSSERAVLFVPVVGCNEGV